MSDSGVELGDDTQAAPVVAEQPAPAPAPPRRVTFADANSDSDERRASSAGSADAAALSLSLSRFAPRGDSMSVPRFGRGMRRWDLAHGRCSAEGCQAEARDNCRRCGRRFCSEDLKLAVKFHDLPAIVGQPVTSLAIDYSSDTKPICLFCSWLHSALTSTDFAAVAVAPERMFEPPSWICKYDDFRAIRDSSAPGEVKFEAMQSLLEEFHALQYTLPTHFYTDWERGVLWANRELFAGHSRWLLQLMRSLRRDDWAHVEDAILGLLEYQAAEHSGDELACTRLCSHVLGWQDAVELLDDWHPSLNVHAVAVRVLANAPVDVLRTLVPTLVQFAISAVARHGYELNDERCLADGSLLNPLPDFLLSLARTDFAPMLRPALFLAVRNFPRGAGAARDAVFRVDRFQLVLVQSLGELATSENAGLLALMELLHMVPRTPAELAAAQGSAATVSGLRGMLARAPARLPWDLNGCPVVGVDLNTAELKTSSRCPLMISLVDATGDSAPAPSAAARRPRRIFHKRGDDLRQDEAVLSAVQLMARILYSKGIVVPLVSYSACAVLADEGLLECVPDATTLYDIRKVTGLTITEWLLHNADPSTPIGVLLDRFVRSAAFWCVASFLLGVCDRNFTNIMLTRSGELFHIDFAFILGDDPHRLFDTSQVALDDDIVRLLGGEGSLCFEEFLALAKTIYLELRPHAALFMSVLSPCPNVNMHAKHNEFSTRFQVGNWDDAAAEILEQYFRMRKPTAALMQYRVLPSMASWIRSIPSTISKALPWGKRK